MGPFLSKRDIVKELGFPIWDDDGKQWFIATHDNAVIGFGARLKTPAAMVLQSAYVLPLYRRNGIYRGLILKRIGSFKGTIHATATEDSLKALEAVGMKVIRKNGSYFVMERRDAKENS